MTDQIGFNAEPVCRFLADHPGAKPSEIRKGLKLREDLMWMTIGWLAGFGAVVLNENGKGIEISLAANKENLRAEKRRKQVGGAT